MTYSPITTEWLALPADIRSAAETAVGHLRPLTHAEILLIVGRAIKAERERCASDIASLVSFAKDMIGCAWAGEADGGYIQDQATKHGLLREVEFNSRIHLDPNGYAEDGQIWYEYAGPMVAPPSPKLAAVSEGGEE
ncbi:hypothetical protein SM0020_12450 [Sinorhizobium meliloti CCNWSX0020]|uniref:Uncharacterized protein n=1 Tax=Sinorhizobium meliloti CCNWSX0020 TaxID=1107881 RepID=H0FZ56_RHIML|nr:hypothetical protein [Sinorhizobium meliloti]EHK77736.1 hypothetical protein SM0020_12450 [Sinorhizobium meliloti CCNWSX0020]